MDEDLKNLLLQISKNANPSSKRLSKKIAIQIYLLGRESALIIKDDKEDYFHKVIEATGLSFEDLNRNTRADLVDLRCIVFWHLKQRFSYSEIGRRFKKTHATIIFALKRYENLYIYNKDFRNKANKLYKLIKNEN